MSGGGITYIRAYRDARVADIYGIVHAPTLIAKDCGVVACHREWVWMASMKINGADVFVGIGTPDRTPVTCLECIAEGFP